MTRSLKGRGSDCLENPLVSFSVTAARLTLQLAVGHGPFGALLVWAGNYSSLRRSSAGATAPERGATRRERGFAPPLPCREPPTRVRVAALPRGRVRAPLGRREGANRLRRKIR